MKTIIATGLALAISLAGVALFAGEPTVKRNVVIVKDGKVIVNEGDNGETAKRGFIGVGLVDLTPDLRKYFGVAEGTGVLVSEVTGNGPADKAGIKAGDVIVSLNGKNVDSSRKIGEIVRAMKSGDSLKIDVRRKGSAQQFLATVGEREFKPFDVRVMPPMGWTGRDGEEGHMRVFELDDATRDALGNMKEYFDSPEWKARVESLNHDCAGTQKRLEELEKRLKDLEKQLPKE